MADCLLITAGDAAGLETRQINEEEVEAINLRMYGWATDYIYGSSQEVVCAVRRVAKRRPRDVPRPRPEHQVLLFEASPSDTSLADQHSRRGWPPYLFADGKPHDYIVIGPDGTPAESGEKASRIAKERGARRE